MKLYKKIIDGKTIIKRADEIVVRANGSQTFNPTESMILADGWVEYVAPIYTPTLEEIKANKVEEILAYDSSSAVNEFSIGGQPMWLPFETRTRLDRRFAVERMKAESQGKTESEVVTTLWHEGQSFEMPLATAMALLLALEDYATICYDNTQRHIAEVQKMESKEAVEAYDYTTGYPQKLLF
jgi:hypothetical protein